MLTENNQTRAYPLMTRLLIAWGAIGPILFILVFLVEGATRPGYSAWRGWALYSLVTGIIFVGSFIACLVVAQLDQSGVLPNSPTGLLERIAIIVGWIWIALLATRCLSQMRSPGSPARSAG